MDDSGDDEFGAHRYFQVDAQLYAAPAEDDPAEPHFQNPSKHLRENSPETDASRRGVAAAAVPARASDELARASQPSKRKRGLVLTQEEEAAWAAARAQAAQFVGVSANRKSSNGWDLTFCFCPCFEGRYLSVLPTAEAAARAWCGGHCPGSQSSPISPLLRSQQIRSIRSRSQTTQGQCRP